MYTILINLDKSLDDLGSGKLLFYPYVRDKKVKIFTKTKEKELNEIFEDVKLHLESMEIVEKEWQVLFLINQNTEDKKIRYSYTVANQLNDIKIEFFEKMKSKKLEPKNVFIIVTDDLERDYNEVPYEFNYRIANQLDYRGYVSCENIDENDIKKVEEEFKKLISDKKISIEQDSKDLLIRAELSTEEKKLKNKVESIFGEISKYFSEEIIEEKIKRIKEKYPEHLNDSMSKDTDKLNAIRNGFFQILFDSKDIYKIFRGNISDLLKEYIWKEQFFVNFLFTQKNLELLDKLWLENKLNLSGEKQHSLSSKFLEELKRKKELLEKELRNLIENKKQQILAVSSDHYREFYKSGGAYISKEDGNVKNISKKSNIEQSINKSNFAKLNGDRNIYLDIEKIEKIEKEFHEEVFESFIDKIIENKGENLLDSLHDFKPSEILERLLKKEYSAHSIAGESFSIIRMKFRKGQNKFYKEDLMKLCYFIAFILGNDRTFKNKKNLKLHSLYFDTKHTNKVIASYIKNLINGKKELEEQVESFRKKRIKTYIANKVTYVVPKISLPEYDTLGQYYKSEDEREWKEWIKDVNTYFHRLIKEYTASLQRFQSDYRGGKYKESEEAIDIEIERKIKKEEYHKKKNSLSRSTLDYIIPNNWYKELRKSFDDNKFRRYLEKRPSIGEVLFFITVGFILIYFISYFLTSTSFIIPLAIVIVPTVILAFYKLKYNQEILIKEQEKARGVLKSINAHINSQFIKKKDYIEELEQLKEIEKNIIEIEKEYEEYEAKVKKLRYYQNEIDNHISSAKTLLEIHNDKSVEEILNNIDASIDGSKIKKLNYEKPAFENDLYILSEYNDNDYMWKVEVKMVDYPANDYEDKNLIGLEQIEIRQDTLFENRER